jgi:hypothetical protein
MGRYSAPASTEGHESVSKKKVQNSEEFFGREKAPSTHHLLPRISPQNHHKNTTICRHNLPKPPAKTPLHHIKGKNKNSWAGSSYSVNR